MYVPTYAHTPSVPESNKPPQRDSSFNNIENSLEVQVATDFGKSLLPKKSIHQTHYLTTWNWKLYDDNIIRRYGTPIMPKHNEHSTAWKPQQSRDYCCGICKFNNNLRETHKTHIKQLLLSYAIVTCWPISGANMSKRKQTKTPMMTRTASSEEKYPRRDRSCWTRSRTWYQLNK